MIFKKPIIVTSVQDQAGKTIRAYLLENYSFENTEFSFANQPVMKFEDIYICEIKENSSTNS